MDPNISNFIFVTLLQVNAVFFKFQLKCSAADAQYLCGMRAVPGGFFQRSDNHILFNIF